jgi:hypothetical protein
LSRGSNLYGLIRDAEAHAVPGDPIDRETHEKDAGPSHHTADYLWIGGAKQPTQAFSLVVAENPDRLNADDPAGMETDRKIQGAGA